MIQNINTNDSETLSPFSRGPNSVDIQRQSQTLGTGANKDTLFNSYDVMNPSYNDEVEEEDNSLRIVIGYYTTTEEIQELLMIGTLIIRIMLIPKSHHQNLRS